MRGVLINTLNPTTLRHDYSQILVSLVLNSLLLDPSEIF